MEGRRELQGEEGRRGSGTVVTIRSGIRHTPQSYVGGRAGMRKRRRVNGNG